MRFTPAIAKYGVDPHARCFLEIARAVRCAMQRLGHTWVAVPGNDPSRGRLIMFGVNQITDPDKIIPSDSIVFNTEQVSAITDARRFISVEEYKNRIIWDYSTANVKTLREIGFQRVIHCPIGYLPEMTTIEQTPEKEDIDVLFYGSVNARRRRVLEGLEEAGLKVVRLFNCYEKERDDYIQRSKIVLNMHHYPNGVFEVVRCSHLFANRRCVVSEAGGVDTELEDLAARCAKSVRYEDIISTCRELVLDDAARRITAGVGFSEFSRLSLVDSVASALEQSR